MTDTNPRDLIKRLADDLEGITEELVIPEYAHTEKERTDASLALVAEARAYLSQPEPEGPTDEELLAIAIESELVASNGTNPFREDSDIEDEVMQFARAVLARWGK